MTADDEQTAADRAVTRLTGAFSVYRAAPMRPALLAFALAAAAWPAAAFGQQTPQPLPPLPSGSAPAPSSPAPPPAPSAQPEAPVDATSAPPIVVPAAPAAPAPAAEAPSPAGPCGGEGAFTHDGFYMRVSTGSGFLAFTGSGPAGDAHLTGVAASELVAIGGTPGRGFVVAGAIGGESLTNPSFTGYPTGAQKGWTANAARIGGLVDWFWNDHRGGHIGGLLALGLTSLTNDAASISWGGVGFGAEAFGGYDFWIGPEWSLGIQGALSFSPNTPLKDTNANGNDTGYSFGTFAFAVQGTLLYH
jgi:hypothetical protein